MNPAFWNWRVTGFLAQVTVIFMLTVTVLVELMDMRSATYMCIR